MDSEQIIAEFKQAFKVPVDAVREAEQRREEMIPLLSDIIADAAKAPLEEVTDQEGLVFMAFHLLGSWQATSAYHAVADLLGSDSEKVEWLLGDAVTITSHRVMFNLFDGDLAPLKRLIENPAVDVYVRRRMFDLLGMLMLGGKLERNELVVYLRDLHGRLEGDPEGLVWAGWAELVAQVGLRELTDLVDESFQAKKIEPMFISRTDFYRILKDAEAGQVMQGIPREFEPFDDLVEESGIGQSETIGTKRPKSGLMSEKKLPRVDGAPRRCCRLSGGPFPRRFQTCVVMSAVMIHARAAAARNSSAAAGNENKRVARAYPRLNLVMAAAKSSPKCVPTRMTMMPSGTSLTALSKLVSKAIGTL